MAKKTNLEIYEEAQIHWDKSNQPHQKPHDFQVRYQNARLKWFKLKAKDFEVTEAVRSDLRPFIREYDFGDTSRAYLKTAGIQVEYVTAVHGKFTLQCNGQNKTYQLPIVPRSIDFANAAQTDPYNQPDDVEPMYIERNTGDGLFLDILSTNTPKGLTVHYLKEPDKFDLIGNRNGYTEEEETQQNEIIDIVLGRYEISNENYNRYQAWQAELQKGV